MTDLDVLETEAEGCTHYGSPRPKTCGCGQYAAFWTLPPGRCAICNKPTYRYDPDGDGKPSTPWCVGCRDRLMLTDNQLDNP